MVFMIESLTYPVMLAKHLQVWIKILRSVCLHIEYILIGKLKLDVLGRRIHTRSALNSGIKSRYQMSVVILVLVMD
jgi:hypothetical protein